MLQISRQQVSERWDVLPDNLKEAVYSESNSNIVWQIGSLNHLSEEKISMMATIVGDVIFGFLHPDDLTREIQESLNLNPQIANSISREISRKIFAPLRIDLEKIFNPVAAMPEIKPPVKPELKIEEKEKKEEKIEVEPKPIEIAELLQLEVPPPQKPEPVIPGAPISTEKPFIIQQETEPKPVGEKKRGAPPIIGWFRKEKPKKTEPAIKVELETLGPKIEERKEPIVAKTEAPKQKVIHYREVEMPTPFGRPGAQPPKPFEEPQRKPEAPTPAPIETEKPAKPQEEPPKPFDETQGKPEEPKVISLDSFGVVKEKDKGLS